MAAQGIGVQIAAPCLVRKRAMVKAGMGMHTPGSPDAGIRAKIFTQIARHPNHYRDWVHVSLVFELASCMWS